jgi:hypothetical protein
MRDKSLCRWGIIVIPGLTTSSFKAAMPFTSRILNPRELLITGVLTRVGIGMLRIEENFPIGNRKSQLTREQKYASLLERIFMEAIGVPFQVLTMYLLQDPVSKGLERSSFLKLPTAESLTRAELPIRRHRKAITDAIQSIYNPNNLSRPKGIICNQVYEHSAMAAKIRY